MLKSWITVFQPVCWLNRNKERGWIWKPIAIWLGTPDQLVDGQRVTLAVIRWWWWWYRQLCRVLITGWLVSAAASVLGAWRACQCCQSSTSTTSPPQPWLPASRSSTLEWTSNWPANRFTQEFATHACSVPFTTRGDCKLSPRNITALTLVFFCAF